MRVARRALASRGRASWMLPQAERGLSLEGRLWRLGMPPYRFSGGAPGLSPRGGCQAPPRGDALGPLKSGQYPHEVLDTQLTPWCGKAGRELRWVYPFGFLQTGGIVVGRR